MEVGTVALAGDEGAQEDKQEYRKLLEELFLGQQASESVKRQVQYSFAPALVRN